MTYDRERLARLLQARLTPQEAANVVRVSRATIWRWMLSGRLPSYLLGGRRYISPSVLQALVQPHQTGANNEEVQGAAEAQTELEHARVD